jgi:thioredoxin 1
MTITNLNDQTFEEFVQGAERPLLVEFSARWCGPCKMLAPVLRGLAADQAGELEVAEIDVDDNPYTVSRYRVMSMPTLVLFVDGEERTRLVGARGKAHLLQDLAEHLSSRV